MSRSPKSTGNYITPQRIEQVIDLVCTAAYDATRTPRRLAKEWEIPLSEAQEVCGVAIDIAARSLSDEAKGEALARLIASVDYVVKSALAHEKPVYRYLDNSNVKQKVMEHVPDYGSALKGLRLQAELLGLLVKRERIEIDPFQGKSDMELAHYAEHARFPGEDCSCEKCAWVFREKPALPSN